MGTNFWGFLVEGLTGVLSWVLNMLPIGNVNAILGNGAAILYFGIAPFLIFVGSFVNLGLLMLSIGTILGLEAGRAIIAGIRLIYKLIPMAG